MGILSRLRERKEKKEVVEEKKVTRRGRRKVDLAFDTSGYEKPSKKDINSSLSLAFYTVSLEILLSLISDNENFIKLMDRFRRDWNADEVISRIIPYDQAWEEMLPKVSEWVKKNAN